MTRYADVVASSRRLALLRLARETRGTTDQVALLFLRDLGYRRLTMDELRADVVYLRDLGLASVEWHGASQAITLTDRGDDVASGRVVVDGVADPGRVER